MTLEEARAQFPGLKDKVYLDAAAVSLTPRAAADGINEFLELALSGDAEDASMLHIAMDNIRDLAIDEASKMMHADTGNIALVESTTHGLNIAANALPLQKGDNVLIADTEYLQVAIPWSMKQKSTGISIRPVHNRDNGLLLPEDFEREMDANTKAVCVSSVQWCSGCRLDMRGLAEICRAKGAWLVVDGVQELGAMAVDLSTQYADFYIAGGHKWLNAPFGCGVMFISDRALDALEPDSYGYMALEPDPRGWGEYFRTPGITPFREYNFPKTAKTFEIAGTSNYPGAAGLGRSLALFNEIGTGVIERHIRKLTGLLHDELHKLGASVVTKPDPELRSGITIFNYYDAHGENLALLEKILEERIFISMRYTSHVGGIRVSTHLFNTEEDIMKLIASVRRHTQ